MDVTSGLRRALSASIRTSAGTIPNNVLLAGQPEGDLRAFLSSTFGSADAVEAAYRSAGGTIIVRATVGDVTAVGFNVDEAQRVVLCVSGSEASVVELRFAIPHSITH